MNELKLLTKIYRRFPKCSSEVWDYPGYQCGKKDFKKDIKRVLLALDYSEYCKGETESFSPDIVITHHPFFFGKKDKVLQQDSKKEELTRYIEGKDFPIYSFHTNFDKGVDGMNDTFISLLDGIKYKVMDDSLMRIFFLKEELSIEELVDRLKDIFSFKQIEYLKCDDRKIKKIAVILGGGSSEYKKALDEGCDLFISGDCTHNRRLEMRRYSLNYIDLPHEAEEKCFLIGMSNVIKALDPTIEIDPFAYEEYFLSR